MFAIFQGQYMLELITSEVKKLKMGDKRER